MMHKKQVTLVSHTHWDRAWYVTFQEFRARLVRLVDRLLKILTEDPAFRVFMLDGQMSILEDYLEVRPERQAELEEYCRQGRLNVGPWYVLADEFLVSPEALIRNLMLGHRMGEKYHGVSKIGYVPDGFGHIAQLPQILRGFGIDNAFFWRGLGEEGETLGTEFTWQAPDGSQVTAIWMPWGYHNLSNLGFPVHWGDTSQMQFDIELGLEQIREAVDRLTPMSHTRAILLMNGIDHEEAEPRLPATIDLANSHYPDIEIRQGTLEDHLANVRRTNEKLPTFKGEFRWGKYSEILQGVHSTRIYLKQANHRVETLLERYAEPLIALAWLSGADVPEGTQDLLWTAWRWLLKNHPHDDLYGSGIDQVHEEMMYRFSQAEQIGDLLVRDNLRYLTRQVDYTQQAGIPVIVTNPLNFPRREIATGEIDFDFDDPLAQDFRLVDHNGMPVPCQVLDRKPVFWMETLKANRKIRVKVAFPADIPACGYGLYFVQPPMPFQLSPNTSMDWAIYPDGARNLFQNLHIEDDGSLSITDLHTNFTYRGLNVFEDVEDAGDEYSYCPATNPGVYSTSQGIADIQVTVTGVNQATFLIKQVLHIPAALSGDRQRRSEELIPLEISSRITLYRDQPGVFIQTQVDNQACDHKLSVVFPTPLPAKNIIVDEAFTVMERAVELPDAVGWVEDPSPLMHHRSFIDISHDGHGLAIFNRGLPSVEAMQSSGGVKIALTLLRCVGWLSRADLTTRRVAAGPLVPTPGAQCPGMHRFEYAIFPHAGDWKTPFQPAQMYNVPLLVRRADTHEGINLHEMNITGDDAGKIIELPLPRSGILPPRMSLISSDDTRLVLSALRRSEDGSGIIVRFYNPGYEVLDSQIHVYFPIQEAWLTDMNEDKIELLPQLDAHSLETTLHTGQVKTLLLRLNKPS